jgi:hypothetical protein
LYIIVVMFMPQGVMGYYITWKAKREQKRRIKETQAGDVS